MLFIYILYNSCCVCYSVYVMENGCMCCSGGGEGDELERILSKMITIMDDESYDYLVIETSGLVVWE